MSTLATSCPNCGAPIKMTSSQAPNTNPTTIPDYEQTTTVQETSKTLKMYIIISMLMIIIGVFATCTHIMNDSKSFTFAPFLIVGGFLLYFVTKFRIWWHHK